MKCATSGILPVSSVVNLATLSLDLATFQTPLVTFLFKKHLATFGKTLATFQMSPVLSCEREILSYTSPCVCSDQWALAPAERSSTFSDRTAADIDVNELRMCTRCCHGPMLPFRLCYQHLIHVVWGFFNVHTYPYPKHTHPHLNLPLKQCKYIIGSTIW